MYLTKTAQKWQSLALRMCSYAQYEVYSSLFTITSCRHYKDQYKYSDYCLQPVLVTGNYKCTLRNIIVRIGAEDIEQISL